MEDFLRIYKILLCLCVCLGQNEATIDSSTETGQLHTCPGEQQTLVCRANYTLLEWSISTINQTLHQTRSVPYQGQNPTIIPIIRNSTVFAFSKLSSHDALPLVSIMTIMNVNNNLEETMVSCTGLNSSLVSSVVLVKVLHVFNVNIDVPNPPDVAVRTDMIHFRNDNFTVTLEWPQFSGETYIVATTPEAVHTSFTTSTSIQLVILYNTRYHVNVTATLCGHRSATNFTTILYAQCGPLLTNMVLSDTATIISGTIPALEGQNVTFSCFGNESWLSVCSEGGRWDPDPTEICKTTEVTKFNPQSTITASTTPVARNQDTVTSTIVSSVVVFILSSFLFFVIGCVCGWVGHKRRTKGSDKSITSQAAPVYEELQLSTFMPEDREKAFELKENVAYGPI